MQELRAADGGGGRLFLTRAAGASRQRQRQVAGKVGLVGEQQKQWETRQRCSKGLFLVARACLQRLETLSTRPASAAPRPVFGEKKKLTAGGAVIGYRRHTHTHTHTHSVGQTRRHRQNRLGWACPCARQRTRGGRAATAAGFRLRANKFQKGSSSVAGAAGGWPRRQSAPKASSGLLLLWDWLPLSSHCCSLASRRAPRLQNNCTRRPRPSAAIHLPSFIVVDTVVDHESHAA